MLSQKPNFKVPICVLIGAGSKLPAIIKAARSKSSNFYISLVVSHRADSPGIKYAISRKIPAIHFKLPDYRKRLNFKDGHKARVEYMKHLGWFISQREYNPALLVFAGWDLVVDNNLLNFFKADFGEGYTAINLHPSLLPISGEGSKIPLPDGKTSPVIKGEQEQVLESVVARKLTYFGPSVHFMVASGYDQGKVIKREFIEVGLAKTVEDLRKKLMPVEDKILVESINEVIDKHLTMNHEP